MASDDVVMHGRASVAIWSVVCQLLLMLACTCLALFGGLAVIAASSDRADVQQTQALVNTAVEVNKEELARNVRDYANWGDLYERTFVRPDRQWMIDNIGMAVSENLAVDAQYVIMADGTQSFGFVDGELIEPGEAVPWSQGLAQLVEKARQGDLERSDPVSGLLMGPQGLGVAAAATVTPFMSPSLFKEGPPPVLLFLRYLSPERLARIGRSYLIDGLELTSDATIAGSHLSLNAADGALLGYLSWQQHKHGWNIVLDTMPLLVAAMLASTGMCFLILRRAYRRGIDLLRHHALHDALTGMPNRALLQRELDRTFAHLLPGRQITLLCLDLDRFKEVNDSLGHDAGDELLRQAAGRLARAVRSCDVVARTGGDEFAILLGEGASLPDVESLCDRLLATIGSPFQVHGRSVHVGLSIGGVMAPSDGATSSQLLKNADIALYRAKAEGRGTYRFFEPEMDEQLQARKQLEHDLRLAIEQDAIDVYFQPQVEIATGRVTGVEALARWTHPVQGPVPPSEFIPLAEQSGLIDSLGQKVLLEACRQVARWPDITVAVNLSAIQFRRQGLVSMIEEVLAATGLPAARLELEITEGMLLDDADEALAVITHLKELGVHIAMDDFGTGYSSLYNLQRYPFDRIKIDRSFIASVTRDSESEAIVRAVIALGSALGLVVTAEGVEAPEQVELLAREGCRSAQGFIYSRAIHCDELGALLHARLGPTPAWDGQQHVTA